MGVRIWLRPRAEATLGVRMPIVEGVSFSYVVHELPRDRLPFRRWRFELWHGARLEAAGWRTTERDALRALHKHGSRVAHGVFGLRPPAEGPRGGGGPARGGGPGARGGWAGCPPPPRARAAAGSGPARRSACSTAESRSRWSRARSSGRASVG